MLTAGGRIPLAKLRLINPQTEDIGPCYSVVYSVQSVCLQLRSGLPAIVCPQKEHETIPGPNLPLLLV